MPADKDTDPCVICALAGAVTKSTSRDGVRQRCLRCGDFFVTGSILEKIARLGHSEKLKLGITVRRANMATGVLVELHSGNLDTYLSVRIPDALELADDVFLFLAGKADRLTHFIDPGEMVWEIRAKAYAVDFRDVNVLIKELLVEPGFLRPLDSVDGQPKRYRITREGYQYLRELRKGGSDSAQVFVAMWFGGDSQRSAMDDVYLLGLASGIDRAGYKPYRVDRADYNGKIDDEIILQIRRSRFLVADFTKHVGGVYYELGYAEGFGLPIIQTCREDQINGLHFDNRQVNTIPWKTVEELADKLHKRIEATIGRGPITG